MKELIALVGYPNDKKKQPSLIFMLKPCFIEYFQLYICYEHQDLSHLHFEDKPNKLGCTINRL